MQVRNIEFQENFRSVTVEASRQQNVLLREADVAQQQAATAGIDEQALNLSRARPASEAEGRTVDPEAGRGREGSPRGQTGTSNEEQNSSDTQASPGRPRGSIVDLTA